MALDPKLQGLIDTAYQAHDAAAQAKADAATADTQAQTAAQTATDAHGTAKTATDAAYKAYQDVVTELTNQLGQGSQPASASRPTPSRR